MSVGVSGAVRDRLLAVGTGVFAASYISAAGAIENSLLSDAVGAGGVPLGVGVALALAALALFIKSFAAGAEPQRPQHVEAAGEGQPKGGETTASAGSVLLRSAGLVLILCAYGLLLPRLGYALTVSLLVLASGWLAGAPLRAPLLLCALFSGPLLWALFDRALQVRMPVGTLWS